MLNFFAKKFIRNKKALILTLLIVFGLVLILPQAALAQTGGSPAPASAPDNQNIFVDIITGLIQEVNRLLGEFILLPLIGLVVKIIQYNGFMDSYAVQIGWPLVRDLSNMFFVIILLIIAFSTILHISSYHYKNTLLKLVIMALLINFSKTILGFFIDFAQVIMLTFVNAFKDAAYSALYYAFGINAMGEVLINTGGETGASDRFSTVFMNFIFLVVSCGVMLAYGAVLLFRIITLWVLVILSPFAFFAAAFPGLKKYSSEYWTKLMGQLSVGVIMAFLLWLAFQLMAAGVMSAGTTLNDQLGLTPDVTDKKLWDSVYTFIVSIALLVLGLQYAQQAGGVAGSFAGKVSGKLSEWGTKAIKGTARVATAPLRGARDLAKTGIKRGAGYLERKVLLEPSAREGAGRFKQGLKYLTKAGWQGWAKRGDSLLDKSRLKASGYAFDDANKVLGKRRTEHGLAASEKQAKESAEEANISGLEDLQVKFLEAVNMKPSVERTDTLRGLFSWASMHANVDDLVAIPQVLRSVMDPNERKDYDRIKSDENSIRARLEVSMSGQPKAVIDKAIEDEFRKKYSKGKTEDLFEKKSRQKFGRFFENFIAKDHKGKVTQEGLNILYNHEENGKKNGHLDEIGYDRVDTDEKSPTYGLLRMLKYEDKDRDPITHKTEADNMLLNEAGKMPTTQYSNFQVHSWADQSMAGRISSFDAVYVDLMNKRYNAQEGYRQSSLGRTANMLMGSTSTEPAGFKEGDEFSRAVHCDSRDSMATALTTFDINKTGGQVEYFSANGEIVDKDGKIIDKREGFKSGFAILKYFDELKNKMETISIDGQGMIHSATLGADGKYKVDDKTTIAKSARDYAAKEGIVLKYKFPPTGSSGGTGPTPAPGGGAGPTPTPGGGSGSGTPPLPPTPAPGGDSGTPTPTPTTEEKQQKPETTISSEIERLAQSIDKLTAEIGGMKDKNSQVYKTAKDKLNNNQKLLIQGNLQLAMQQSHLGGVSPRQFSHLQREFLIKQFKQNTQDLRKFYGVLSKDMLRKLDNDLSAIEKNPDNTDQFVNFMDNYGIT